MQSIVYLTIRDMELLPSLIDEDVYKRQQLLHLVHVKENHKLLQVLLLRQLVPL